MVACEPAQNYKRHIYAVFPSTWQEDAGSHALWIVELADDWSWGTGDFSNKGTLSVKAIGTGGERELQYPQLSV